MESTWTTLARWSALLATILAVTSGIASLACHGGRARTEAEVPEPDGTPPSSPRDRTVFFLSGHSLTDDPLAEDLVATATSLGLTSGHNEQIILGSTIQRRTRGTDRNSTDFAGYLDGKNRSGSSGLDIVAELASPTTVTAPYDALVITERHDVVSTLIWEDTVRYLRHFHDRLVTGNPNGVTYVYHSWLGVPDKSHPASFLAYERTIYPVWECIAERIEVSLDAAGSSSQIVALPAGIALTDLVEEVLAGTVPGLSSGSTSERMNRLFSDDVHLTRVGAYYMSLVTFASIFRRSPVGAAAPSDVDADLAARLQAIAWDSVVRHHHPEPRGLAACRAYMRDVACDAFVEHTDTQGALSTCLTTFAEETADGPFAYSAGTDASYWLPAP